MHKAGSMTSLQNEIEQVGFSYSVVFCIVSQISVRRSVFGVNNKTNYTCCFNLDLNFLAVWKLNK